MQPNYLASLFLIVCMVFSTSAAVFLHLNEHQHVQPHAEHHHAGAEHHHDHNADIEADHGHHFNLHVIGDLVEYDPISFSKNAYTFGDDSYSRLISRTYLPPLPPPNA
ncbi:hypothetical protein [Methylophaga sp. OBS4]|uniref:hypothetical protein n=1 Tax=Methylophaga sp. OBS4 TaxID=2991935 RepID=UPI00225B2D0E|nr:hypothetical protein [Methylophaga sp. OBS4]MCX4186302.1 hypothetical protein [Methylophaga sp. OBS4]